MKHRNIHRERLTDILRERIDKMTWLGATKREELLRVMVDDMLAPTPAPLVPVTDAGDVDEELLAARRAAFRKAVE